MSNYNPKIEIQGSAPFTQPGVYEVQIAITDKKPSEQNLIAKNFPSLWKGSFHLRVKDGVFTETIGGADNPLPESVFKLDSVWIVVTDQFSTSHSVFNLKISEKTTKKSRSHLLRNLL